jgi:hypothetical protein
MASFASDEYQSDLSSLVSRIDKGIDELRIAASPSADNNTLKTVQNVEDWLKQADEVVKGWEVEVRQLEKGDPSRQGLLDAILNHKTNLTSKKSEFARAKNLAQRSSLIGDKSMEDRGRVLDAQERLALQTRRLEQATSTIYEAEEIGTEVLVNLGQNREKIESSHAKTKELRGEMDKAEKLTKSMQGRENCLVC